MGITDHYYHQPLIALLDERAKTTRNLILIETLTTVESMDTTCIVAPGTGCATLAVLRKLNFFLRKAFPMVCS